MKNFRYCPGGCGQNIFEFDPEELVPMEDGHLICRYCIEDQDTQEAKAKETNNDN